MSIQMPVGPVSAAGIKGEKESCWKRTKKEGLLLGGIRRPSGRGGLGGIGSFCCV